ncbi:hypothetical protein U14_02964 [Candidatus Moduliflexus flocculans]|uniref:Methyltransferase, TIGR04325 family n=1 Tax=Candidatus Moduliflexus flocculans TaxID=1499966 RepID=A0A081BMV3_9BACT|nr:hypothetical protein U14_02964 [Candidatus Moduliflexus flocculans]
MKMCRSMINIARSLTPPFLWNVMRRLRPLFWRKTIEWEYLPGGWPTANRNPDIKGWDVESILHVYQNNWPTFVQNLKGTSPLGISPESGSAERTNLAFHNLIMTYGYVLAIVARGKTAISMLDWGGSIGHYYLLSQTLLPDLKIEYHCKDFPRFVEYGKTLFPDAHFHSDESCLNRKYDFMLSSSSLQYSHDWQAMLARLRQATSGYLFVTRLPVVQCVPSYIMVQRPYQYGYQTEYISWCINRQEFLAKAEQLGLIIAREFLIEHSQPVYGANEQPECYGFLFRLSNQELL